MHMQKKKKMGPRVIESETWRMAEAINPITLIAVYEGRKLQDL